MAQSLVDLDKNGNPHRFGCYRFSDASCVWDQEMFPSEFILDRAFSTDGQKIAILSSRKNQCMLRLLNAADGVVLSQLVLPGITNSLSGLSDYLLAWQNGFLLNPPKGLLETGLWVVKIDPLRLEVLPMNRSYDARFRMSLSRDGRWLALNIRDAYDILTLDSGTWKPWLQGESDNFNYNDESVYGAHFSPDSRLLLVHTDYRTRIIDLAAKKVLKDLDQGSEAMAFSPDGRTVVATKHSGLSVLNTTSWTWHEYELEQHNCPLEWLHALPDNKTLLSADHNGIIVWDLPSLRPRALLKGGLVEQTQLGNIALADDRRHIITSDGRQYLKWRMPDLSKPVPAKPEIIQGVPAFEDLPSQEECQMMNIFADARGRRLITVQKNAVQLRDWNSPGTVRTITSTREFRFPLEFRFLFLDDQHVCVHSHDEIYILYLDEDRLETISLDLSSTSLGAWLPEKKAFITAGLAKSELVQLKGGQSLATFKRPSWKTRPLAGHNIQSFPLAETVVVMVLAHQSDKFTNVGFWSTESGELLALLEVPGKNITSITITPDAKILALGHNNTAISLWDVEKILQSGPPQVEEAAPVAKTTGTRPIRQLIRSLPDQPMSDGKGLWNFHEDGSCSVEGRMAAFALLEVNGTPWRLDSASYLKKLEEPSPYTFSTVSMEGRVPREEIHVSRRLGKYFALGSGKAVFATDGLTNIGSSVKTIETCHKMRFPADTKGLITDKLQHVHIPADGYFSLGEEQHWLAPTGTGKPGEMAAVVRVKHWTTSESPALHWEAATKTLSITHRYVLQPGETVWLLHALTLAERLEGGSPDALNYRDEGDPGFMALPASLEQAGNFGKPWNNYSKLPHDAFPTINGVFSRESPMFEKDGLGQVWQPLHDAGRRGEMGVRTLLQPWFDGLPAASAASLVIRGNVTLYSKVHEAPSNVIFSNPAKPVVIIRHQQNADNGLSTVWSDLVTNNSDAPQQTTMNYITTFKSPVMAVHDALGNTYTRDTLPVAGTNLGGALAFVLEGEMQPATLIAFHRGGSKLAPTIRWMGPQAVSLDFHLRLDQKQRIKLLFGACQRPLQAYGSPMEAFGDWLPLTTHPSQSAVANPQSNAPKPEILNYETNTP